MRVMEINCFDICLDTILEDVMKANGTEHIMPFQVRDLHGHLFLASFYRGETLLCETLRVQNPINDKVLDLLELMDVMRGLGNYPLVNDFRCLTFNPNFAIFMITRERTQYWLNQPRFIR